MTKDSAPKTPKRTEAEWTEVFEGYLAQIHCCLFSRSFDVATPKSRKICAEWLANVVMEAGHDVDRG